MISECNFVNGQWKVPDGEPSGSFSANRPEVIWTGDLSSREDIEECVSCAQKAAEKWAKLPDENRALFIKKFEEKIKARREEIALAISQEIGAPLWESIYEVDSVLHELKSVVYASVGEAADYRNESRDGAFASNMEQAGVVGICGSYYLPCLWAASRIVRALAAGNAVIFVPHERAPMCGEILMECWADAEIPKGVVNLLLGDDEVKKLLVANQKMNAVFLAGSNEACQEIKKCCAESDACTIEVAGDNPIVVWDTQEMEKTVQAVAFSAFLSSGQRFSSAKRVIVPKNEFGDRFLKEVVAFSDKITVGRYHDKEEPDMGPVSYPELSDAILDEQDRLEQDGAVVLKKAEKIPIAVIKNPRQYAPYTLMTPGIIDITDVNVNERSNAVFAGPFLKVLRVDSFEDAIEECNKGSCNLVAGIFANEPSRYEKFKSLVHAEAIKWNQPLFHIDEYKERNKEAARRLLVNMGDDRCLRGDILLSSPESALEGSDPAPDLSIKDWEEIDLAELKEKLCKMKNWEDWTLIEKNIFQIDSWEACTAEEETKLINRETVKKNGTLWYPLAPAMKLDGRILYLHLICAEMAFQKFAPKHYRKNKEDYGKYCEVCLRMTKDAEFYLCPFCGRKLFWYPLKQ